MKMLCSAASLALAFLLIGCAQLPAGDPMNQLNPEAQEVQVEPPEKRHSAKEIRGYTTRQFQWPAAAAAAEQAQRLREHAMIIDYLTLPSGPERDAALPWVMGAVALFNVEGERARAPLLDALTRLSGMSVDRQRALLTAAHTLYASDAAPLLWPMLSVLATPREFSIAAYTVLKGDRPRASAVQQHLHAQFPQWQQQPHLRALDYALGQSQKPVRELYAAMPPLVDLLAAPLRPGVPVVFSVQRPGRESMGLALVRGADGRFVRQADGGVLAIAQLALARSGLPGTITLGNTPQGVFTVRGAGTAKNRWIGPTPYLESKVPIEATVAEFEHQPSTAEWSEAHYASFLPPSWRTWEPIKEAWLAGLAGRTEMLMHGTTIDPAYYSGASYFPGTPSAGCLVTSEAWGSGGEMLSSDQLILAKAFTRDGHENGYLVVVETLPSATPVQLEELQAAIETAEARIAAAHSPRRGQLVPQSAVLTSGRMVSAAGGRGWLATWPGVNWSLRFEGRSLGVRLVDNANHYVLEVDGAPRLRIAPDRNERLLWLHDLPAGEHTAQLIKLTESPHDVAHVIGFELDGGRWLDPSAGLSRRIEFIGDSYTAAMGNMSADRKCTGAQIGARTDISQGFAVLAARMLHAEWQTHAKSGMGLVRNWDGALPKVTHGTHYQTALQTDTETRPAPGWFPQVVVIGLGTNDFSTPVRLGEPRDAQTLEVDYLEAYRSLMRNLRLRYGNPAFVLLSLPLRQGDKLRPLVQRLVDEQVASGNSRVVGLDWGDLQNRGCGSHPDAQDHQRMANMLVDRIKALGLAW